MKHGLVHLVHYYMYIFLPGYGYNGIFCGHCQIAVGVHWMEFVSRLVLKLWDKYYVMYYYDLFHPDSDC
jgi:hypothetical protein